MLNSRQQGFSVVELMVALATLSIVVLYAMQSFTTQHQTYVVIEDVSETQQSLRTIASLLERDIRNAGYMVPSAAAACGVDNIDAPDVLFVSDADAVLPCCSPPEPVGEALDRSLSATPLGATTTTSPSLGVVALPLNETTIDGNSSYDTDADGANDSDFQIGGGVIVADLANPGRGVACGFVTAVNPGSAISADFVSVLASASGWAGGTDLRVVPAHSYRIQEVSGIPRLERDGILLAKDVEDLQFAWYYDDDGDGLVDQPGEVRGVPGVVYDAALVDGRDLREIRFNAVSRTKGVDPRQPDSAGARQATENRDASVPDADGHRRRVQTATVRLRNISL